jgi:hypothetical protein
MSFVGYGHLLNSDGHGDDGDGCDDDEMKDRYRMILEMLQGLKIPIEGHRQ